MAHRTQPPSRDEIAEQAIDFIESLGHPLVPWQAEMLRAMFKHDGPVEVYPQPRKHDHTCMCHHVEPLIDCMWRCGLCGALHEPKPKQPQCLCTMGYSKHCPVHGKLEPPQPGMVRVQRDGEWAWETPTPTRCPCGSIAPDEIGYDWRCSQCGTLHERAGY